MGPDVSGRAIGGASIKHGFRARMKNRLGPRHIVTPAQERPQAARRPYSIQTPEPVNARAVPRRRVRLTRGSELTACWGSRGESPSSHPASRFWPGVTASWVTRVSGSSSPLHQSSAVARKSSCGAGCVRFWRRGRAAQTSPARRFS